METTTEETYQTIRGMLGSGELLPGRRVSQLRLARQLGCSPQPVVEALRRLQSEGLVIKQPRKMARVRELSRKDLQGLYLLRCGLECEAVQLCTRNISDRHIEHLQKLGEQFEASVDRNELHLIGQRDIAIHRFLVECADCPLLLQELDRLVILERTAGWLPPGKLVPQDARIVHRAIIQAVADRDGESAAYLMRKHLYRGLEERLALMESED